MKPRLFHIHTLSALHCGTGQSVGVVDLPIARSRATNLPIVPGSSLRGVLRQQLNAKNETDASTLFGPKQGATEHFAGALAIGDASLLALPVRCLGGIVCYATAPFILRRYASDRTRAGLKAPKIEDLGACEALVSQCSVNTLEDKLVLEDVDLNARGDEGAKAWAAHIADIVHANDSDSKDDFVHRFAILPDDVMDFLAETATEVRARIAVDNDTGTVKDGALWYEENLPAEAVLWGMFALSASNNNDRSEDDLAELMPMSDLLQLGGKAGVGRGLARFLAEQGT